MDTAAGGTDASDTRPDDIPGSNYRIKDFADIGKRSVEVRFKHNLAAVRVLKEVEARGTRATELEKDLLVRYSGWGGLGEVFKSNPSENWAKRSAAAKEMMTEEEMESGMRSSNDAYFTPGEIVTALYHNQQMANQELEVFAYSVSHDLRAPLKGATFRFSLPYDLIETGD